MNNKGRRQELRQLKFRKRLKNLKLKQDKPKDYVCYKDQGKPCSCGMCSGEWRRQAKDKKNKEKLKFELNERST